ncbi:hypothetical protein BCR43DRAFT_496311 [Syncephalastrum racemosum]|uniref:Uncharacterized protein n=1 Tax=Syncephalastrum racemosum TaxID=13706 RepID=A0A1X2H3V2_SYNRA|nr:hypothetical protein BCR43DRAFT_496311 [Syncephalastrum racemosum]
MRSRGLRITSLIVVFPVALILVSLVTIFCLAVSSQVKNVLHFLFPRGPPAVAVSKNVTSATAGKHSFFSLALRLIAWPVLLTALAAVFLIIFASRKLRTRHAALDNCLEALAEYGISGTKYLGARQLLLWPSALFNAFSTSPPSPSPSPSSSAASSTPATLYSPHTESDSSLPPSAADGSGAPSSKGNPKSHPARLGPSTAIASSASSASTTSATIPTTAHYSSHLYIPQSQLHDHSQHVSRDVPKQQHLPVPDKSIPNPSLVATHHQSRPDEKSDKSLEQEKKEPSKRSKRKKQQKANKTPTTSIQTPAQAAKDVIVIPAPKADTTKKNTVPQTQILPVPHSKPAEAVVEKQAPAHKSPRQHFSPPPPSQQQQQQRHHSQQREQRQQSPPRRQVRNVVPPPQSPQEQQRQRQPEQQTLLPSQVRQRAAEATESAHISKPKSPKNRTISCPIDRTAGTKSVQQSWYSPFSTGLEIDLVGLAPGPSPPAQSFARQQQQSYGNYQLFGSHTAPIFEPLHGRSPPLDERYVPTSSGKPPQTASSLFTPPPSPQGASSAAAPFWSNLNDRHSWAVKDDRQLQRKRRTSPPADPSFSLFSGNDRTFA